MTLQPRLTSGRLGFSLPLDSVWLGEVGETGGLRNPFLTLISSLCRYPHFSPLTHSSLHSSIHVIPYLLPIATSYSLLHIFLSSFIPLYLPLLFKSHGDGMVSNGSRL